MAKIVVMKLRPPFKCHGGKNQLAPWIISHFPANYNEMNYVEPFGGGANVLLNKDPSLNEVYNDINPKITNIFHCIKECPGEFFDRIKDLEYTEKSFKEASKVEFKYGSCESAVAELTIRRMSRGGLGKNFSWSQRQRGGRPGDVNAWETFKLLVPKIAERLKNTTITNYDQVKCITENDNPNTLWYCDPPYVHSTRTATQAYDFEMTDDDHRLLAETIKKVKGKVIISGYDSILYKELYKGWRCACKSVKNNAGQGKTKSSRIEVLWLNY